MADAFSLDDTTALLRNKSVLFMGDSNVRAQYKDLVWLLNKNTLIGASCLKKKLESSFLGDKLVVRGKQDHGRDFQEVREYDNNRTKVGFMFIPQCFNRHIENLFKDIRDGYKSAPDVIVINSCMWDLTRWGPNGVPVYKDNMVKLMRLMSQSLPRTTLVIWTTALPTAAHVRGGLIIKQIQCMEPLLRFEVMEANTFARDVVVKHGFDLLDNHFHNRMQIHRRAKDGIHYSPIPTRLMTNLLLTHVALSWGSDLPGNIASVLLNKAIYLDSQPKQHSSQIPNDGIFAKINLKSPTVNRTQGIAITIRTGEDRARQCTIVHPQEEPDQQDYQSALPIHRRLFVQAEESADSFYSGPIRNRNNKKKRNEKFYKGHDKRRDRDRYYH